MRDDDAEDRGADSISSLYALTRDSTHTPAINPGTEALLLETAKKSARPSGFTAGRYLPWASAALFIVVLGVAFRGARSPSQNGLSMPQGAVVVATRLQYQPASEQHGSNEKQTTEALSAPGKIARPVEPRMASGHLPLIYEQTAERASRDRTRTIVDLDTRAGINSELDKIENSPLPQLAPATDAPSAAQAQGRTAAATDLALNDASAFAPPSNRERSAMTPVLQAMAAAQSADPRLKTIRELLAAGRKAEARAALERLRIEHPDIVLDRALLAVLETP